MVAVPYLFNEIGSIFRNTPTFSLVLELILLLSVIWLILHKRSGGRKRFTKEQEDYLIEKYEPEPLVADTDPNHPLLRTRLVESRVGRNIRVNGHDCINLGSFNYLGLLDDMQVIDDACKCLRKYGVGSCGPRGFYGTMDVHLDLEERLAKFMHVEEAIVYSYGFSTIASAIPAYAKRGDIIFVDEQVNFAIQKGLEASRSTIYFFKHNDVHDLERLLVEQDRRDKQNVKKAAKMRRFLVVEGIYINTGEICPLPELIRLRIKYKVRLFLDETVSFGTLGKGGRGVTEHFNVNRDEIDLISASMEGALATIGGFCVGSHFIAEHQRLSGLGYIFSASLPPMLTQAAISALDRFEREPQIFAQLQQNARCLHKQFGKFAKLRLCGNELSPIKHLYLANDAADFETQRKLLRKISNECIKRGIAVIEAAYLQNMERKPVKPSLRVITSRLLTETDINKAFKIIEIVSNGIL